MSEFLSQTRQFLAGQWPVLVPVLLGAAAVYLLLPRPRRHPPLWGALAGGLALVLAGWWLARIEAAPVEQILFYAFAGVAVLAGAMMISQSNPVHAALSFALVVLSTCGLFLLQAAPFLMAATTIVYAGAIVVTFLFVIMLAQQAGLSDADRRSREPLLATVASFVLLGALLYVLHTTYDTRRLDDLLARADAAAGRDSVEEVRSAVGDENAFFEDLRREADRLGGAPDESQALREKADDAAEAWRRPGVQAGELKRLLHELADAGRDARNHYGGLRPRGAALYFGVALQRADAPRENVAPLGLAFFTDYLLPVELAGTLLLVATIGAIAIAGRRAEGLR